jgi:hypothetical protein
MESGNGKTVAFVALRETDEKRAIRKRRDVKREQGDSAFGVIHTVGEFSHASESLVWLQTLLWISQTLVRSGNIPALRIGISFLFPRAKNMSGQIFISYRREDSWGVAGRLSDRLGAQFGRSQIFMDLDSIELGGNFMEVIETTVAKCDVLLAVIGNNWLTTKDEYGDRRLANPADWVRKEIGTALQRQIRVIPILVGSALMPRSADLPEDLKPLVSLNALRLTSDSFEGDLQRLAAAIRVVLEKAAAEGQDRLEAEARQREEQQRLAAEQREKARLEAKQREKDRLEAEQQEKERLAAEQRQRENERLLNERREKDRLEAERLEAEHQIRLPALAEVRKEREHLPAEGSAHAQNFESAQAETPPIVQTKGSTKQRPSARVVLVVSVLILTVGLLWFAGSKLNYRGREAALPKLNPIPESSPASSSTPTSTSTPARDRYISKYLSTTPSGTPQSTSTPTPPVSLEGKVPPAVQALIEQLKDEDADSRHAAATSLGNMGVNAGGAVPALIERVADDVWGTQGGGVRDAVNTDNAHGNTSKDAALKALKQLAPDRVEEALIKGTKSTNPRTRAWASAQLAANP